MDLRHHPVLAVVSNCYSEPKGRFPRVTHPCATRPEGLVRLACVRHAASVRSEPESNSQVDDRQARRNRPGKPVLWEPFLHKYTNWCVCVLGHLLPSPRQAAAKVTLRNGINLTDRSIPRGYRRPGRRPHVPSSKPTMSKSRRVSSPGPMFRDWLDRSRRGAKRRPTPVRAAAVAGGRIWGGPRCVNGFLQLCCAKPRRRRSQRRQAPLAWTLDGPRRARFNPSRAADWQYFHQCPVRRCGYTRASRPLRLRSAPCDISPDRRSTRFRESRPLRPPANGESAAWS